MELRVTCLTNPQNERKKGRRIISENFGAFYPRWRDRQWADTQILIATITKVPITRQNRMLNCPNYTIHTFKDIIMHKLLECWDSSEDTRRQNTGSKYVLLECRRDGWVRGVGTTYGRRDCFAQQKYKTGVLSIRKAKMKSRINVKSITYLCLKKVCPLLARCHPICMLSSPSVQTSKWLTYWR